MALVIGVGPFRRRLWPRMPVRLAVAEAVEPELFDKEGVRPGSEGVRPEYWPLYSLEISKNPVKELSRS